MRRELTDAFSSHIIGRQVPHIVDEYTVSELVKGTWVEIRKEYQLAVTGEHLVKINEVVFAISPFLNKPVQ